MAIILPNTRNALGVPNRYSDLASAGLRWTPSQPETGYSAYRLYTLMSTTATPANCIGNSAGKSAAIINGKLFFNGNVPVGVETDWTACSGESYNNGDTWYRGYAIRAGKLYVIDANNNATQIGTATNWEKLSGYSSYYHVSDRYGYGYAINAAGELYMLSEDNSTRVGALTGWELISGASYLFGDGSQISAVGIAAGKLYKVLNDVATQIGMATNWATVGPTSGNNMALAINDDGELFVVKAAASAVKVGTATNWTIASRWHAINAAGELYSIDMTTAVATQVGTATNWSDVSYDHALNTAGEIYTLAAAVATRFGSYSDWTKIDTPVFVRSTAESSSNATSAGLLFATGSNGMGQLGLGDSGDGTNRSAFSLVGDRVWSAIAGGYQFTIGVSNGELYAWGDNTSYQLGLGDTGTDNLSVPTKVGSATNWVSVAAGKYHALAVNDAGELYAWGGNTSYRLGLGDTYHRNVPTKVGSATNWLAVAAGGDHSIAVNTAGEIYAWGSNQWGKTGLGVSEGETTTPTKIGNATNWLAVAAGKYASFAVNADGELYSWGYNSYGVLGIGSDREDEVTTPTRVGSATNWATVAAGLENDVLATTLGGALYAWGMNDSGQLGLGDTTNRNAPVQVGSAENWVSISTGDTHSAAVNSSGELYTWGAYTSGRLGQGSAQINTPTRVGTGTGWLQVAAGQSHTLATMALTGANGLLSASGVMDSYGEVYPYASATWSIDGGTTWNAGGGAIQLPAGTYTLTWGGADEFTLAPASSSVTITAGQATVVQGIYTSNW